MAKFGIYYFCEPGVLQGKPKLLSFDLRSKEHVLDHVVLNFDLSVFLEAFICKTLNLSDFSDSYFFVGKL